MYPYQMGRDEDAMVMGLSWIVSDRSVFCQKSGEK
jgi:hypothetical protein